MDDSSQTGLGEDNEDDIEYVVERLDEDEIEDQMEFEDVKENIELNTEQEEEKEMDNNQSNEDSASVIKKIKILPEVIYVTNAHAIIILYSKDVFVDFSNFI